MDVFAFQRNIDSVSKALPDILAQIVEFQREIRAHRADLAELDGRMIQVLNLLERVSLRQTEIELQLMGVRGATQR